MVGVSKRKMFVLAAVFGAAISVAGSVRAASTISSNNSSVTFSSIGTITNWVVDGTDEFGGSPAGGAIIDIFDGANFSPLTSNLTLQSSSVSGNTAQGTYSGMVDDSGNVSVTVKEVLVGGSTGSGSSTINETITVKDLNVTPVTPPLDFIPISETIDANLNATPNDDTLTLSPAGMPTTAVQTDPTGVKLTYTAFPSGLTLISNGISSTGVGPSTGNEAFEADWYLTALPGQTLTLSNTFTLSGPGGATAVPLPNSAAMALATLAGLGIAAVIRRKKAKV